MAQIFDVWYYLFTEGIVVCNFVVRNSNSSVCFYATKSRLECVASPIELDHIKQFELSFYVLIRFIDLSDIRSMLPLHLWQMEKHFLVVLASLAVLRLLSCIPSWHSNVLLHLTGTHQNGMS